MNQISSRPFAARAGGTIGEVVQHLREGWVLVEAGTTRLAARRAVSCLVEPEPGDVVLIGGDQERTYVLAVLEREGTAPVRLVSRGDTEVVAAGGRLSVIGETAVEVLSPARIGITAPEVSVTGRLGRMMLDQVVHVGQALSSHVQRLKLVGEALETILERVMTRAKRSYRLVEEEDHLRARSLDHRAEGTLRLHGKTTIVTGSTLAKVDAGQIHIG
jgi:hypothetical protein